MTKPVFSISGVGKCARTQSASLLKLLPSNHNQPEFLQRAAREGNRHERWIREDLPELGYTSVFKDNPPSCNACGREGFHIEYESPHFIYRGHFDDLAIHTMSQVLFLAEYKALGRFGCERIKTRGGVTSHRSYHTQVSLYDAAYEGTDKVLWVIKNRDTGKMEPTVLSKDDLLTTDEIDARQLSIMWYVKQGILAPCDTMENGSDIYSCTYLCDEDAASHSDLGEDASTQILEAVRNMRIAKELEAVVKPLKKEATGTLTTWMAVKGKRKITVDGMEITLIKEGTRNTYTIPDEVKIEYRTTVTRPAYIRTSDKKVEKTES